MREMLEEKLKRFEELERQMVDPAVLEDGAKIAQVAREHGSLMRLATKYRRFKAMVDEIVELNKMQSSADPDERAMAEAELPVARANREEAWNELLDMTVGGDDAGRNRCVMEIRAGTGGAEAALFAQDRNAGRWRSWKRAQPIWVASARSPWALKVKGSIANCSTRAARIVCSGFPKRKRRDVFIRRPPRLPYCLSLKMWKST